MNIRLITTAFFLLVFISVIACLNESRVLIDGRESEFYPESYVPRGKPLKTFYDSYEAELKELDSTWKAGRRTDDYSDYGVLLAYLKRYDEAKKVFVEIEKINPGLYTTAANLGTTYELLGENKLALAWIKKAVKINATSHKGSEWLHVKILEAKVGGEQLINSDFLIGTNFGSAVMPETQLDSDSLVKLRDVIYFQLNERISFIKPKEKIVALLLFELGNVCALTDDINSALQVYDMAKAYGYESEILNKRYAHYKNIQAGLDNDRQPKQAPVTKRSDLRNNDFSILVTIIAATLLMTMLIIIRSRKKSS